MAKEFLSSSTPALWQVELTNHCPYECAGCPRRFSKRPKGKMDFSVFKACILSVESVQKHVRPLGLNHFGESLLHPEIARMISFSTQRDVPTQLSCNPELLSPGLAQDLILAGLKRITFSLDGMDRETLQKLRGAAADYDLARKRIADFLNARDRLKSSCEVRIQMVAYRANQHQWESFLEEWKEDSVFAYIKKFDTWTCPDMASMGAELMKETCVFPFRFATVLWDGRVVPCCHDYDGEVVLGRINDGLDSVWEGKAYNRFRSQFLRRTLPSGHMCRRCAWWPGNSEEVRPNKGKNEKK